MKPKSLALASASPRRRELLSEWGIPHRVVISGVDEDLADFDSPQDLALHLAQEKARAVAALSPPEELILGADTIVVLAGKVLGKPKDQEDARAMLRGLSGQTCQVLTGVAIIQQHPHREFAGVEMSELLMRPFDDTEIEGYLATGEPMGKAGAFAIQGRGGALIAELLGSRTNVIGLPKKLVTELLGRFS